MIKIPEKIRELRTTIFGIVILASIAGTIYYIVPANRKPEASPTPNFLDNLKPSETKTGEVQPSPMVPISERLSDTPSEREIYGNPLILHIRTALNGYLAGNHTGIDSSVLAESTLDGNRCGMGMFEGYYKSKFFVWNAENNTSGGVAAKIIFVDKPDTIFYTWVNKSGGGYVLKSFCESGPPAAEKAEFSQLVKQLLSSGEIRVTL